MIAMDLNSPAHPITRFFTSTARPNGAWSRAGMAWAFNSLFVQTADGVWNPSEGLWGQTLLRLAPKTLKVLDYFTPPNLEELNTNDLDYGSGGTLGFTFRNRDLIVSAGKDGTVYLLDAKSLGGADHRTRDVLDQGRERRVVVRVDGRVGRAGDVRERAQRAMGVLPDVGSSVEEREVRAQQRRRARRQHHGVPGGARRRQAGARAEMGLAQSGGARFAGDRQRRHLRDFNGRKHAAAAHRSAVSRDLSEAGRAAAAQDRHDDGGGARSEHDTHDSVRARCGDRTGALLEQGSRSTTGRTSAASPSPTAAST